MTPKVNVISPKVNVEYFKGILEELEVFEIFCWGSRSQGLQKYLSLSALKLHTFCNFKLQSPPWTPEIDRCLEIRQSNSRAKKGGGGFSKGSFR